MSRDDMFFWFFAAPFGSILWLLVVGLAVLLVSAAVEEWWPK